MKKWQNNCFSPWVFFQSEDSVILLWFYMHNSIPLISFAIFSGFFQNKYCGLILFCYAADNTIQRDDFATKFCEIVTTFSYFVAKLRLEFSANFKPCYYIMHWGKWVTFKSTAIPFVCPPKFALALFLFSLGTIENPRETGNYAYAKFWRASKEYCGVFQSSLFISMHDVISTLSLAAMVHTLIIFCENQPLNCGQKWNISWKSHYLTFVVFLWLCWSSNSQWKCQWSTNLFNHVKMSGLNCKSRVTNSIKCFLITSEQGYGLNDWLK